MKGLVWYAKRTGMVIRKDRYHWAVTCPFYFLTCPFYFLTYPFYSFIYPFYFVIYPFYMLIYSSSSIILSFLFSWKQNIIFNKGLSSYEMIAEYWIRITNNHESCGSTVVSPWVHCGPTWVHGGLRVIRISHISSGTQEIIKLGEQNCSEGSN